MKLKLVVPLVVVLSIGFAPTLSHAQNLNFSNLLSAGVSDANLYLQDYISPFMKGFGYGMSNGWYNTAKPHRPLGLDITATVNVAFVPDKDLLFDFEGFNSLSVESGPNELPTIFGPKASSELSFNTQSNVTYIDPDPGSPTFGESITSDEVISGDFPAPDGIDLEEEVGSSFVPVPMVQLGVGLIKNTELKLRLLPTVSTDDFEFKFFGIGVMHDFKQWTPGISHLPFDASVFIGYTRLRAETRFDTDVNSETLRGSNQAAGYEVKSLTIQIVASKTISILTFYGGFGFNRTNSVLKMTGTYIVDGETEITLQDGTVRTVDSSFELPVDPVRLNFNSSGPRATIGARIKLLILTIHAGYTVQEYNTLTAGIGVTIR